MTGGILFTLIASPGLEEPLVDWLLEFKPEYGFSSFPVNGHSSRQGGLSLAEQVSGRKRQVRFEMHLPEAEWRPLVERLNRDFAGAGIHYWVSPVIEQGRV
ncbi:DUF3240 family protein [Methylomagnum sp.]